MIVHKHGWTVNKLANYVSVMIIVIIILVVTVWIWIVPSVIVAPAAVVPTIVFPTTIPVIVFVVIVVWIISSVAMVVVHCFRAVTTTPLLAISPVVFIRSIPFITPVNIVVSACIGNWSSASSSFVCNLRIWSLWICVNPRWLFACLSTPGLTSPLWLTFPVNISRRPCSTFLRFIAAARVTFSLNISIHRTWIIIFIVAWTNVFTVSAGSCSTWWTNASIRFFWSWLTISFWGTFCFYLTPATPFRSFPFFCSSFSSPTLGLGRNCCCNCNCRQSNYRGKQFKCCCLDRKSVV